MERAEPRGALPAGRLRREALEAAEDARRVLGRQAGAVVGYFADKFPGPADQLRHGRPGP